eukprot:NODE_170_length_14437_cov_1.447273.p3 type:complete len:392 gc:universal NODE_170_length_14437_cov_1.447273:3844-2669(-)
MFLPLIYNFVIGVKVFPYILGAQEVGIADISSQSEIQLSILDLNFTLTKTQSSPAFLFNGTSFEEATQENCYYISDTSDAFHLCDGVYGTFISPNGTAFKISPLDIEVQLSDLSNGMALHELEISEALDANFCGFDHIEAKKNLIKRALNPSISVDARIVGTMLYLDYSFYQERGKNAIIDAQNFFNGAASIYRKNVFEFDLSLNLTGIVVINSDLLIVNESPVAVTNLLPLFYNYVKELQTTFTKVSFLNTTDISFLLSHQLTEPSSTVGLAYLGGACGVAGVHNVGLATRLSNRLDTWVSLIIAHEIGHLLNSQHDGTNNQCMPIGNVMASVISDPNPSITTFSSCSKSYINSFLKSVQSSCLLQTPQDAIQNCGNGFLDPGEEYLIFI